MNTITSSNSVNSNEDIKQKTIELQEITNKIQSLENQLFNAQNNLKTLSTQIKNQGDKRYDEIWNNLHNQKQALLKKYYANHTKVKENGYKLLKRETELEKQYQEEYKNKIEQKQNINIYDRLLKCNPTYINCEGYKTPRYRTLLEQYRKESNLIHSIKEELSYQKYREKELDMALGKTNQHQPFLKELTASERLKRIKEFTLQVPRPTSTKTKPPIKVESATHTDKTKDYSEKLRQTHAKQFANLAEKTAKLQKKTMQSVNQIKLEPLENQTTLPTKPVLKSPQNHRKIVPQQTGSRVQFNNLTKASSNTGLRKMSNGLYARNLLEAKRFMVQNHHYK